MPSKAEDKIIERMLSGRGPIEIVESKENVVDTAEEIAKRQRLAANEIARRERLAEDERDLINSSEEIARRQRLAANERDLANYLRAHTPTTDEANITSTSPATTTESTAAVDSVGKGR